VRPALVALDVDGTITDADHALSELTLAVLSRLRTAGVTGVIVTGRAERSAVEIARSVGFTAPVVSCNGALVTDPVTSERLWLRHMDPVVALRAVRTARKLRCDATVWTADAWYVEAPSSTSELLAVLLGEQPRLRPLEAVIAGEEVVKVMLGGDPALLDALGSVIEARVPGMVRSMRQLYEVAPVGATKREALVFVLQTLAIAPEAAWGFGDSGNDVGWMSLLGRAIAPANAFPGVLELADVVIGHHAEDGVAQYLVETILS
jgi:Cof subfamily protein (haloacid dehalogenase superfamily)